MHHYSHQDQNPYEDDEMEVVAHLSPNEARELTELQGGDHYDERTKLPSFMPLLKLLSNPAIKPLFENLVLRSHHAEGGSIIEMNEYLSRNGLHGDTVPVKLPRPLANFFDEAFNGGKPSINPHTGKRQYFLGNIMGGMKNLFSPLTNAISDTAGRIVPAARDAIGAFGTSLKNANLGGAALNTLVGAGKAGLEGGLNPIAFGKGLLTEGAKNFAPIAADAFGKGAQAFGDRMGMGDYGKVASDTASHLIGNVGPAAIQAATSGGQMPSFGREAARAAAHSMEGMTGERSPFSSGVQAAMSAYGGGASPYEAAAEGVNEGINRSDPMVQNAAAAARSAYDTYHGGGSPLEALRAGYNAVSPDMRTQAFRKAGEFGMGMGRRALDQFAPRFGE